MFQSEFLIRLSAYPNVRVGRNRGKKQLSAYALQKRSDQWFFSNINQIKFIDFEY